MVEGRQHRLLLPIVDSVLILKHAPKDRVSWLSRRSRFLTARKAEQMIGEIPSTYVG